jgi:hypothetical protein
VTRTISHIRFQDKETNMTAKLQPGQAVRIEFNHDGGGEFAPFTLIGEIVQNIDATCYPLTNMWRVEVTEGPERGSRFGISGKALFPVAVAA